MAQSREARLIAAFVTLADTLTADYDVIDLLQTLLQECIELLGLRAGGLMLADTAGTLQLAASTSEQADFVEIMQLNGGTGPCVECFRTGVPVSVPDAEDRQERWPDFRGAVLAHGFRRVHALPMRLRDQVIGTMNLFGADAKALSSADAGLAQALTDVATIGILQERMIRESGVVTEQLQRALESRILIEQAKGVLSESASIGVDAAFAALRGFARANRMSLRSVADAVVARTIDIPIGTERSREA